MRILKHTILILSVLLLLSGAQALAQDGENSVTVEVKTEEGQPLGRACVTLVPKWGELIFRKADGKGRVVVKKLTPGSYRVVVKVDGYEAQKREVAVGSSPETVAFLMQPREKR
jgi:hypothetical protein